MEIARNGDPISAEPPASPALPACDDPQRAAFAFLEDAPSRFFVRRIQLVECDEAHARGTRLVSKRKSWARDQNSDFAAALAAVISGAG